MEPDVVIVRAGLTGFALAYQLIRYGVDFVFIEKYSEWIDCQNFAFPAGVAAGIPPHIKEIFGADESFWRVLLKSNITGSQSSLKTNFLDGFRNCVCLGICGSDPF
jgi:flavin-dependent dehydrogenase